MKILCLLGRNAYGDPRRGAGVEFQAFVPALQSLGHDVKIFDSHAKGIFSSYATCNQKLLEAVNLFQPECILNVQFDVEVWIETLLEIRRRNSAILINWSTDDTWKYAKLSCYIGRYHHGMATTYVECVEKYKHDGVENVHVTQWAANKEWLQLPKSARDCRYQVSFVGIAYGDRRKIISELAQKGIEVACFGHQWPAGSVAYEQMPIIMRDSVISLNFSKGLYGGANQIKARNFEVPGAGGFLLTEHAPGIEHWYDVGTEIAVWDNIDDLAKKIQYYLENPELRDEMALRAHARTVKEHLYEHRMSALVDFASSLSRESYESPELKISFTEAMLRHRSNALLRTMKGGICFFCRIIWGKDRSKRYARRIALELFLKFRGVGVYSGVSWFGRMFPPELL